MVRRGLRTGLVGIGLGLLVGSGCHRGGDETLGYHRVRTDAWGRIEPWYGSGPSEAYDHVVRLTFQFWVGMRACPNGVPYYLQHQVWDPAVDDGRGIGGDQVAMALSSWNLLHGYLGDPAVKQNMILMADYVLDHGLTGPGAAWANLPYTYNLGLHSGVYDGDMRAGLGYVEPDKAASLGAEWVGLYKITGDPKYLQAATAIADTLAAKVQPGDGDHSPWPYRVHAATGAVHSEVVDGRAYSATYTTNYTGALHLFADLAALGAGDPAAYQQAAQVVRDWLKAYPLKTHKWGPFFEDIPTSMESDTEINADTMAAFILEHPEWDLGGAPQARRNLEWSLKSFGNPGYRSMGVVPIDEQTVYRFPGNSHSARHASVELLYGEKTGDGSLKDAAIRRLNWATYMVDTDGKNKYVGDGVWLTDGYGDYVRHYLRAMASLPELAPENQNHLLRTTSVVQSMAYGDSAITYTKFDALSTESFKLGDWHPSSIQGGQMNWDPARRVLTVQATSNTVTLTR